MKLQKIFAYDYKTKDGQIIRHHKYNLVIPELAIEKLGWRGTDELDWEVKGEELVLKPVKMVKPVHKVRGVKPIKQS